MKNKTKDIIKLCFHIVCIIVALVLGFFVVAKGIKFDFLGNNETTNTEETVVSTEVSNEYLENQLLIDWKDKVLTVDEYFKNLVFAEYDREYLDNRYYSLKESELPLDTDFIASTYESKLSDTLLNYYLNRAMLTGVTFDPDGSNPNDDEEDIIAFGDTVYASDISKKVNLNKVILSGNGNFVIWYTDTGSSAISDEQAQKIASELEVSRYTYDKMYNHYFSYKAEFVNAGTIRDSQLKVYNKNNLNSSYLTNAMQVYVVNYTDSAAAKYVVADNLNELYEKFQNGSKEGAIPGPYLIVRASSYKSDKERTMQIVNRELFRHYQYNVYCPEDSCVINDDPLYFDTMANYASAMATSKTSYRGFLNEWSAVARNHTSDLLSDEVVDKYGNKNISNALYLYLYYYAKDVTNGQKYIIDALYTENPFKVLEEKAGDNGSVQIVKDLAMGYIRQDDSNDNVIASPDTESKIVAKANITSTYNIDQTEIEKLGIDYYVLDMANNNSYKIEFGRNSSKLTCLLIGVSGNNYTLLNTAQINNVNIQFSTDNYPKYDKYYIVVANSSILEKNIYSLDIIVS